MGDVFTQYEAGLARLLDRVGTDHSRYADVLVYQQRLQENIAQARLYGDSDVLKHQRAQIIDALNQLAIEVMRTSFNKLCESPGEDTLLGEVEQQPEPVLSSTARLPKQVCEALRDPVWQGVGAIIAIVALAIAIGTWFWPDIRVLLHPPTPTLTVTSTPKVDLTDARVLFIITLSNGDELEVPADGTLTLTSGDVMLIEMSVIVGNSLFPRDLTYQYFASRGGIPEKHIGPRASYVAPELPALDVITVVIKDRATGDTITRCIKVVVKERSS